MKIKKRLLAAGAAWAFMLMLCGIASLFVEGATASEVLGTVADLLAWLSFSYLYHTRGESDD